MPWCVPSTKSFAPSHDSAQPLEKIKRLKRSQPLLVQQFDNIVDDRVLSLSKQVGLRDGRFRDLGAGILATELGDDIVRGLATYRGSSAPTLPQWWRSLLETVASSRDIGKGSG